MSITSSRTDNPDKKAGALNWALETILPWLAPTDRVLVMDADSCWTRRSWRSLPRPSTRNTAESAEPSAAAPAVDSSVTYSATSMPATSAMCIVVTAIASYSPGRPGATPRTARITLTTCYPRYASSQRLIVFGKLTSSLPRDTGRAI